MRNSHLFHVPTWRVTTWRDWFERCWLFCIHERLFAHTSMYFISDYVLRLVFRKFVTLAGNVSYLRLYLHLQNSLYFILYSSYFYAPRMAKIRYSMFYFRSRSNCRIVEVLRRSKRTLWHPLPSYEQLIQLTKYIRTDQTKCLHT